jgi:hypothetical protein
MQDRGYEGFLRTLLSHWRGTHVPDPTFSLPTLADAKAFYQAYRSALGVPLSRLVSGDQMLVIFASAYEHLERGEPEHAEEQLRLLITRAPHLADAWVWWTAIAEGPADRQRYLETALRYEPGHPLARDALGFARGKIPYPGDELEDRIILPKCPQCGGELHYEPGATGVECRHCGTTADLSEVADLHAGSEPVSHLQLRRLYRRQAWPGLDRVVQCQACGAELALTHYQARRCAFCGSTNVLTVDAQRFIERPDLFFPFVLDEQQARDAILTVQRAGLEGFLAWLASWNGPKPGCMLIYPWGTLRTLDTWRAIRHCRTSSIAGMYLPYWLFDGIVEIRRSFGRDDLVPPLVQREGFDNLVYPGVDRPRSSLLERMHPFDWKKLAPYEPHLLADWPIRVHSLDVESLVAEIQRRMTAEVRRRRTGCRPLPATTEAKTSSGLRIPALPPKYRVRDVSYRLVLVPVWIAILANRERRFWALVNGQTGKVVLEPLGRGTR